ncbi:MAG: restriction endonuclease [Flavobacteriaceae bacterium]|uniref:Restriction endonuclease n=1 Tax=Flavobacterium kayseriense TaxID=2764714 RepID=A0ABR7J318_9FLAO|nr:ATP cone domain-containing protein [Flavobacterium kayseriense]MBC5839955.1 restriction endonuclease [Flavobacterium kayseriense]MBC5847375.1 restriction endonuclease [Flavobacterium kayseriense]MBX9889499.1 restriction endonuclease [Flavobacteriaceae bacterium]
MKIIKNSGEIVDFDAIKLRVSLTKSGASKGVVDEILNQIKKELYEGITTKTIYKKAFSLLKKQSNSHAARYNLRSALLLLGPAGFFFEKYIARIFQAEGCETKINMILQGKCVSHEIDVLFKKEGQIAMVECKFHGSVTAASDVKVPLYIHSRFNDLKVLPHTIFSNNDVISECWIATNNRFTSDAITYAACAGLKLLSWNYPKNNNLKTKNDRDCLYPVTCLTTISLAEKDKLLFLDVILVKELLSNNNVLKKVGLSENRIKRVLKEAAELCRFVF